MDKAPEYMEQIRKQFPDSDLAYWMQESLHPDLKAIRVDFEESHRILRGITNSLEMALSGCHSPVLNAQHRKALIEHIKDLAVRLEKDYG